MGRKPQWGGLAGSALCWELFGGELVFALDVAGKPVAFGFTRVRPFAFYAFELAAPPAKSPIALKFHRSAVFVRPRALIPHEELVAAFHRRDVKAVSF